MPPHTHEEAKLQVKNDSYRECIRNYMKDNFSQGGEQESNLTAQEIRGLKSLKKRKNDGEIVITITDKSNKF